jgi:hypothetical protein
MLSKSRILINLLKNIMSQLKIKQGYIKYNKFLMKIPNSLKLNDPNITIFKSKDNMIKIGLIITEQTSINLSINLISLLCDNISLFLSSFNYHKNIQKSLAETLSNNIIVPLNSLLTMTNLLYETHESHQLKNKIDIIFESSFQIGDTIGDIFDFTKLQSAELKLNCKKFNIIECFNNIVNMIHFKLENNNINLSINTINTKFATINTDKKRFKQFIINIINFMIIINKNNILNININTTNKGIYITINNIIDNITINSHSKKNNLIFEPFQKIKNLTNNSGMQLYIAYNLIKLMNGTIFADIIGNYVNFQIFIPAILTKSSYDSLGNIIKVSSIPIVLIIHEKYDVFNSIKNHLARFKNIKFKYFDSLKSFKEKLDVLDLNRVYICFTDANRSIGKYIRSLLNGNIQLVAVKSPYNIFFSNRDNLFDNIININFNSNDINKLFQISCIDNNIKKHVKSLRKIIVFENNNMNIETIKFVIANKKQKNEIIFKKSINYLYELKFKRSHMIFIINFNLMDKNIIKLLKDQLVIVLMPQYTTNILSKFIPKTFYKLMVPLDLKKLNYLLINIGT